MQKWRLVVFDWDGTLMDSAAQIVEAVTRAAVDAGISVPAPDAIRDVIGLGLHDALSRTMPDLHPDRYASFVELYRGHFLSPELYKSELFPGTRDVLHDLYRREFLMGVATGKGRRGLDRELGESKLHEYFHVTRCADETFSKPHPQMLEEIMDEVGVLPEHTLMVGDTEYDMEMAANAGIRGIGVSYGVHGAERLKQCKPLAILKDLRELPEFLSNPGVF